jgi:hypothetical protein
MTKEIKIKVDFGLTICVFALFGFIIFFFGCVVNSMAKHKIMTEYCKHKHKRRPDHVRFEDGQIKCRDLYVEKN